MGSPFIKAVALVVTAVLWGSSMTQVHDTKPNILVIMGDDIG
jgi:hypothetical protein